MVRKSDSRAVIDVHQMALNDWLELIETTPVESGSLVEDYRFPTDRHAREYLATVTERSEEDVKQLLRHFLILSGGLGHDRHVLRSLREAGPLEDSLRRFEFCRRLLHPLRDTWEGNKYLGA